MFCRYCGKPLIGNRCNYCGYRMEGIANIARVEKTINENSVLDEPIASSITDIFQPESVEASSQPKIEYGMKWYKFLIYFALFAGAVLNCVMGIMALSGKIYEAKLWAIIYGLALVGLAVFAIVTRFLLAKFKKSGPICLYVLYIISPILEITGPQILHENLTNTSDIASMGASMIMLIVNIVYFKKRKSLFIN